MGVARLAEDAQGALSDLSVDDAVGAHGGPFVEEGSVEAFNLAVPFRASVERSSAVGRSGTCAG